MFHVKCFMLNVSCFMFHVLFFMLYVICYMLYVICYMLYSIFYILYSIFYILYSIFYIFTLLFYCYFILFLFFPLTPYFLQSLVCFALFDRKADGAVDREELCTMLTALYTVCKEITPSKSGKPADSHSPNTPPAQGPEPAQQKSTTPEQDVASHPERKAVAQDYAGEIAFFVDKLFNVGDVNKDGVLTPDEFREVALFNPCILKTFNLDGHQEYKYNLRISVGDI
jgi:EF hand